VVDHARPPGVVDQDVEVAEALDRAVDEFVGLGLVGDVGADVQRLSRQGRRDGLPRGSGSGASSTWT
jgi:hypothetical protein